MEYNRAQRLLDETIDYLQALNKQNLPPPKQINEDILGRIRVVFDLRNASMFNYKEVKWKIPDSLSPSQIAVILNNLHIVRRVSCTDGEDEGYDLIAVYQEDGPDKGLYRPDEEYFNRLARQYQRDLTESQLKEVRSQIRSEVPRAHLCNERHLIAVNNGIFNFDTKQLLPFTPDKVFLTKCRVDYVASPKSPVIHNSNDNTDWEVEEWIKELSDDDGVPELIWEIMGAAIRPNVRWNKAAFLYSEEGNNGKGTLCALMRNLCGKGNCASINLHELGEKFALEPLIHSSAIIVDENPVGTYIDDASNAKSIITNDTIRIDRKYRMPISFQFRGFMVQCLNGLPKVKDKSDSFYRRQLLVPFRKCFTGMERKYIKDDYINRKEVLEYVLWRILNMDYYSLSEPAVCKEALGKFKVFNNPILQFWSELRGQFVWDLLPYQFLYDMYKGWCRKTCPSGQIVSKNTFMHELKPIVANAPDWTVSDSPVTTGNKLDIGEPLIGEYNVVDWMDQGYSGNNPILKYRPGTSNLKSSYRGLQRVRVSAQQAVMVKP